MVSIKGETALGVDGGVGDGSPGGAVGVVGLFEVPATAYSCWTAAMSPGDKPVTIR
jgi:hypothetical protein